MKRHLTIGISVMACTAMRVRAGYELLAAFERPAVQPMAPLSAGGDGRWYATASAGGANGLGAVVRVGGDGVVRTVLSFGGSDGAGPVSGLTAGLGGEFFGTTSEDGAGGYGTVFRVTEAGVFATVLSFTGTGGAARGAVPQQLVRHGDGNFYGTTAAGGAGGFGTVFRLTSGGVLTTLVEFTGAGGAARGARPVGAMVFSGNTLYGVTREGGSGGFGTVFSVTTSGVYGLLAEFSGTGGARPGANPAGGLLLNSDGNLYGTTEFGGANDFGTAWRLTTAGTFTSLRAFADATGSQPTGALARAANGLLYGTTASGGAGGFGTVFSLTTGGVHAVVASLTGSAGAAAGSVPRGGLTLGGDGWLYGTASAGMAGENGGIFRVSTGGVYGVVAAFGTTMGWMPSGAPVASGAEWLFSMRMGGVNGGGTLVRMGVGGAVTVDGVLGGLTGSAPEGGLVRVGADYFGVASGGGANGRGTVYRFGGTGAALVSVATLSGGSLPDGPLVLGSDGGLYGTAREGGATGRGTVYKVTAAGVRTRLVSFTGTAGTAKGSRPRGGVVLASNASYYGVTEGGGAADAGTIFRMTASGVLTTIGEFTGTGPRVPLGGLVAGVDGALYGTVSRGGAVDGGALIRVRPASNDWAVVAEFGGVTGVVPAGPVAVGADGVIYGMTTEGGTGGYGAVWKYRVGVGLEGMVSFTGNGGAAPGRGGFAEGGLLVTGGLAVGADGVVTGTTPAGGVGGGGTVFRFSSLGPLQQWKLEWLGDAEAMDLGDPDFDGVPNLVEYGLLLNPTERDAAALPAVVMGAGGLLESRVRRDPARSDVTVSVEAANDLAGPWNMLAMSVSGGPWSGVGYVSGEIAGTGVREVLIRDGSGLPGARRRFLRHRVVR
ncbi:MAG: hypothetical protein DVB22_002947 [Verrucomicrobia bacterium]|nr:MAG: hypothetical protein DVB22_002947 [Verrucomicrobiota bacterium]